MNIKGGKWVISFLIIITSLFSIYAYGFSNQGSDTSTSINLYSNMAKNQLTTYTFHITYHEDERMITGRMNVKVPNQSNTQLEELYFHLYPNAFMNWKWDGDSKPKTKGYIKIHKVMVNNFEVFPHQRKTLLKINLPAPLKTNEVANIDMDFSLKIPTDGLRLTHFNKTTFLAQWYPMLAVYDEKGWHLDPYSTVGDPFFSDIANYKVHLTLPSNYFTVSTAIDPPSRQENKNVIFLSQEKVRDFAIMITKEYEKLSVRSNHSIKINLYYLEEQQEVAGLLIGIASEAMDFFGDSFGDYPMKEIDIILANSGNGIAGMEYPGLVTSNSYIGGYHRVAPAYNVVAHELAHQWWYSTVGNDQIHEPWLDEGLTSFSEYLFLEQILNEKDIDNLMEKNKLYTEQIADKNKISVLDSIYSYGGYYAPFVYGRPAAMLWELKKEYGIPIVKKILRNYYDKFKYKIATTEDFIQIVNTVIGKDMTPFFKAWLIIDNSSKSSKY